MSEEKEGKNPGGRPRIWDTPEEIQEQINKYFSENKEHPTITGLSYFLGFNSRQSFYNYEQIPEFLDTIKRARLRVECFYEIMLLKSSSSAGVIFALKNLGWSDKQEIDHTTKGEAINKLNLSDLSDDDLLKLKELLMKAKK